MRNSLAKSFNGHALNLLSDLSGWGLANLENGSASPTVVECLQHSTVCEVKMDAVIFAKSVLESESMDCMRRLRRMVHFKREGPSIWADFPLPPVEDNSGIRLHILGISMLGRFSGMFWLLSCAGTRLFQLRCSARSFQQQTCWSDRDLCADMGMRALLCALRAVINNSESTVYDKEMVVQSNGGHAFTGTWKIKRRMDAKRSVKSAQIYTTRCRVHTAVQKNSPLSKAFDRCEPGECYLRYRYW